MERRMWQHDAMINQTAPFLDAEVMADLMTSDRDVVTNVLLATREPWYWNAQQRIVLLVRSHSIMHDLGMEAGNSLHDQCIRDVTSVSQAINRAPEQVWN